MRPWILTGIRVDSGKADTAAPVSELALPALSAGSVVIVAARTLPHFLFLWNILCTTTQYASKNFQRSNDPRHNDGQTSELIPQTEGG